MVGKNGRTESRMGDFQATPQGELAHPFAKWMGQAERIELSPRFIGEDARCPSPLGAEKFSHPVTAEFC